MGSTAISLRLLTDMFIYSRGFNAILKQDRKKFAGVDIPIIDNDYTGSDLQVLVKEHIEAAM